MTYLTWFFIYFIALSITSVFKSWKNGKVKSYLMGDLELSFVGAFFLTLLDYL